MADRGRASGGTEIDRLIDLMARLPGLGPRSARRAALYLVKRRERLLAPLAAAMADVADKVVLCTDCGNIATASHCTICTDPRRTNEVICVVADVADLWALERANVFRGRYHVLGGMLSVLDGITPETLRIPHLVSRVRGAQVHEVILALSATVEGQTTAHVIAEYLADTGVRLSSLAQGVPVGGELDYLDDGTITAAIKARHVL